MFPAFTISKCNVGIRSLKRRPCGPPLFFFCMRLTTCFFFVSQELEKLISFSGTPTCVWRRTGEICLVGDEFCLLTEWSKDELLDPHGSSGSEDSASSTDEHTTIVGCRKKFIYEVSPIFGVPQVCLFRFNLLRPSAYFVSPLYLPFSTFLPLFCFNPSIPIADLAVLLTVVREPISGRVLGKLCVSCVREHNSICGIPLRVTEAERGPCSMHVLFLNKTGYYGSTEHHYR